MAVYVGHEMYSVLVGLAWMGAFFYRKQLMVVLLSLEFMILGLFMSFAFVMLSVNKSVSLTFYLLVMGACEASLGLSLLVAMSRYAGSDTLSARDMC